MKTYTFYYSCIIATSPDALFRFHTDPRNLPVITPPWLGITLDSYHVPMREGNRVKLTVTRLGIPTTWEMEIEQLRSPRTIVDRMISGPFRVFRHERNFAALSENQTRMTESITIALPLGWAGTIALPFVRREMDAMFDYRHRATRKHFKTEEEISDAASVSTSP